MSSKDHITKLYLSDATLQQSVNRNVYSWVLSSAPQNQNKVEIDLIEIPFSWYLFDDEILTYSGGTPVLNGSFNTTTLPAVLATLFGAATCTISDSTLMINMTFGAPVTLNISQWSSRAQYFLGAGTADLAGVNITFPFPVDLGGDRNIEMHISRLFTNKVHDSKTIPNKATLAIPISVNPFEVVYWEPQDFYLESDATQLSQGIEVEFFDRWGGSLNLNQREGFLQYRSIYN